MAVYGGRSGSQVLQALLRPNYKVRSRHKIGWRDPIGDVEDLCDKQGQPIAESRGE